MENNKHPGVWLFRSLCAANGIDPDARGAQQKLHVDTRVSVGTMSKWARAKAVPDLVFGQCLCEEYGIAGFDVVMENWRRP